MNKKSKKLTEYFIVVLVIAAIVAVLYFGVSQSMFAPGSSPIGCGYSGSDYSQMTCSLNTNTQGANYQTGGVFDADSDIVLQIENIVSIKGQLINSLALTNQDVASFLSTATQGICYGVDGTGVDNYAGKDDSQKDKWASSILQATYKVQNTNLNADDGCGAYYYGISRSTIANQFTSQLVIVSGTLDNWQTNSGEVSNPTSVPYKTYGTCEFIYGTCKIKATGVGYIKNPTFTLYINKQINYADSSVCVENGVGVCKTGDTNYYVCQNNLLVNQGPTIGKCGVPDNITQPIQNNTPNTTIIPQNTSNNTTTPPVPVQNTTIIPISQNTTNSTLENATIPIIDNVSGVPTCQIGYTLTTIEGTQVCLKDDNGRGFFLYVLIGVGALLVIGGIIVFSNRKIRRKVFK